MLQPIIPKISALLAQASSAHHQYEQTILKGLDQDWPTWYANYVIQNGLVELLNQPVTVEQISQFFRQRNEDYEREHTAQDWADYTAQKIIEDFSEV
jgi:hypothetical protein